MIKKYKLAWRYEARTGEQYEIVTDEDGKEVDWDLKDLADIHGIDSVTILVDEKEPFTAKPQPLTVTLRFDSKRVNKALDDFINGINEIIPGSITIDGNPAKSKYTFIEAHNIALADNSRAFADRTGAAIWSDKHYPNGVMIHTVFEPQWLSHEWHEITPEELEEVKRAIHQKKNEEHPY